MHAAHYGIAIRHWIYAYVTLLAACCALSYFALFLLTEPTWYQPIRWGLTLSIAAVAALGNSRLYNAILTRTPKRLRFLPNLNGVFETTNRSNWCLKDPNGAAQIEYRRTGELPDFTEDKSQASYGGRLSIQMSLFHIAGQYEPEQDRPSSTRSQLDACQMAFDDRRQQFVFSYIYSAQANGASVRTDDSAHLGAAQLFFADKSPTTLNGEYWTNRAWTKGLNTAGLVSLRRIDK